MKKISARLGILLLSLLLLLIPAAAVEAPGETKTATILFTHDMHSHLLPAPQEGGGEFGGFARLKTLLDRERAAAAGRAVLTVDGGDFSMGTLFQTIYTSHAAELRMLGAMGFDATTLGNHEFEYRGDGLAKMLRAALGSGETLPPIVQANYTTPKDLEASQDVVRALGEYGVSEYIMLEKDGVRFAVFGLLGKDADGTAPLSGMAFEPIADAARRVVAEIREKEDYDFIVCLSHSGTDKDPKKSEDELLAKAVDGIDFIVSGHTHTVLTEPVLVNNTIIGSLGAYANFLGSVTITKDGEGRNRVDEYRLIPIDETVAEDTAMAGSVARYKTLVERDYLSQFGLGYDQVLAHTSFDFTPTSRFALRQEEDSLGNIVADAYLYAVRKLEEGQGKPPVVASFTNAGVIRASFAKGDITVSNAFDVSSIGSGADGTPGYPLIDVWLTGREIKNLMEVDPSVGPIFPAAQLYSSGVRYDFNMRRMIFNRMTNPALVNQDGSQSVLEDDKLYRVVSNLYSSQMLGLVTEKSFGILKLTPKDAQGNPITNYEEHILYLPDGGELKEWYAMADYLQSFPRENGVPQMPERYSGPDGRKLRVESISPVALLKSPNWVTLLAMGIVLVLIALVLFVVWRVAENGRRRKRTAGSYRRYRG